MQFLRWLHRLLVVTQVDVAVGLLLGVIGFALDVWLFAGGITTFTVSALSATTGIVLSKLWRRRTAYVDGYFAQIDRWVKDGHVNKREGSHLKQKFIQTWFDEGWKRGTLENQADGLNESSSERLAAGDPERRSPS
jgi:hypothetical protein